MNNFTNLPKETIAFDYPDSSIVRGNGVGDSVYKTFDICRKMRKMIMLTCSWNLWINWPKNELCDKINQPLASQNTMKDNKLIKKN